MATQVIGKMEVESTVFRLGDILPKSFWTPYRKRNPRFRQRIGARVQRKRRRWKQHHGSDHGPRPGGRSGARRLRHLAALAFPPVATCGGARRSLFDRMGFVVSQVPKAGLGAPGY